MAAATRPDAVKSAVRENGGALAVNRDGHTEYLAFANGGWGSYTKVGQDDETEVLLPVYGHNVDDRLQKYPVERVGVEETPFAGRELGEHDLDPREVDVDA